MSLPPGDTVARNLSKTGIQTSISLSGTVTISDMTTYVNNESRPTYSYGSRSKVGALLWLFPTSYSHYSRKITQGNASFRNIYSDGRWTETSQTASPIFSVLQNNLQKSYTVIDSTVRYNVESAAKVKALNKLGDAKAQIGEDLATYLQTVRMFKSKADLLHALLNNFKKGKLGKYIHRSARDVLKNGDKKAAHAYLEYVYGWKPLVSDIYGIVQLLKQYSDGAKPIVLHGHGSQIQSSTTDFFNIKTSSTSRASVLLGEKFKGTCDIYARVDPQYIVLRMLNQLGLLNPAAFLWELTPWSFVVDWFIPIGPLLGAFSAPIGLNFISGTYATRLSRSYEGSYSCNVKASTAVAVIDRPCVFTAADELYNRGILTGWPFPTPYLNLNPFSGDRSFKALALAIARLRR